MTGEELAAQIVAKVGKMKLSLFDLCIMPVDLANALIDLAVAVQDSANNRVGDVTIGAAMAKVREEADPTPKVEVTE